MASFRSSLKLLSLFLLGVINLPLGVSQSQAPPTHPPLVTTCQIMPLVVAEFNAGLMNMGAVGINCTLSANCTQIQCSNTMTRTENTIFTMDIQTCKDPLTIRIAKYNDTTKRIVYDYTLYSSQMIGLDLGFGFATLNFSFVPRTTRLSFGIKVDEVDLSQGTTIPLISRTEVPVDVYSCPGTARPSETCKVMDNIAQYLNYFFTGIRTDISVELTPDCIPSTTCNSVVCVLPGGGYYKYSVLSCQNPPALHLAYVLPNLTLYYEHVSLNSEVVPFTPSPTITLNITFNLINPSTVGIGLSFTDSSQSNQTSHIEIPYVVVPLNKSACAGNYTHLPLVSSCDVLPLLSSPMCIVEQQQQECNKATCEVMQLNATIEIDLFSCYNRPTIGIVIRDIENNAVLISKRTEESVVLSDPRAIGNQSQISLTVRQHSRELSVGVQVASVETNEVYIQYHELPVNKSTCPNLAYRPSTITCEAMTYIAQFLNVFFANVTNQLEATPDCVAQEPNCNNITCTFMDNSYYSLDILPCIWPAVFHLEYHAPNGTALFKHTFTSGTKTQRLDEDTQVKVTLSHATDLVTLEVIVLYDDGQYSFILPAIPSALIPLDTSGCKGSPPPPPELTTSPTTVFPKTTLLAIEIAAPVGGVLLAMICILCCAIMCLCVRQSRLKHDRDNYNFQRLSIAAQDYEDPEDDDDEENEGEMERER